MATYFVRFLQLVVYLVIASQLVFYLFILSDSLKQVSIGNFIELRKVIDVSFGYRFKIIYYTGLPLSLIAVLLYIRQPGSILFITTAIGCICLMLDMAIAVKGNLPINALINSYQPGDTSQNLQMLRLEWIKFINIRAGFIIVGMAAQFIGLIFTKRWLS